MIRYFTLPSLLASLLVSLSSIQAAIIRIPQDEASVQDGCDNSQPGDTLRISAGRWEESVLLYDKFLTIEGDTSHPEECIINPTSGGPAFQIIGTLRGQSILRGLTLSGGTGNTIDNVAYGGGIYCQGTCPGPLLIERCNIIDNRADLGGGCYSNGIHILATGCRIENNSATSGGAIYCDRPASSNYQFGFAWTIIANNSGQSSIIELNGVTQVFMLRNCTITQNTSNSDLLNINESQVDIQGSILWQNNRRSINRGAVRSSLGFRYSLIEGGQQSVTGRIDQWTGDMLSVSPQFTDAEADNFSLSPTSPCIDHGYPYNILDNDGSRSDMGAIPFQHHKGIVISLTGRRNGEPIDGATIAITTPRQFHFELTTDDDGFARVFDFPDNAHTGSFSMTITHPVFIDQQLNFQMINIDTTELHYALTPADFDVSPPLLSVNLPRGNELNTSIDIRNNTEQSFRWAIQNLNEYSILNEFETEEYGRVEGTAFDGEHFYLPNCYAEGDRWVYVLDHAGELVDQFRQPNQDGTGFRDIEWDGESLWAIGDRFIYKLSTHGQLSRSWQIGITGTSITWDSDRQLLWITGPFSSIIAYDVDGNRIEPSLQRRLRVHHGISYFPDDPQGYSLYILTTGENDENDVIVKMNPTTLDTMMVGPVEDRAESSVGLGLNLTSQYNNSGKPVWLLQTVDSTQVTPVHKLSLLKFNDTNDWLLPRNSKGLILDRLTINLTVRTITGLTDTLDVGDYETTLTIAFDLPSEKLTIPVRLHVGPNDVASGEPLNPNSFSLEPPYPNPFNSTVTIEYSVPQRLIAPIDLSIYDLNGRLVEQLVGGRQAAGKHKLTWNAEGYATGEYVLMLNTGGERVARKMVLVK